METSFGEYIRKLRTVNGMTLTQLAAQLELDSANLSKIENGKREFDEKRLEKLATVFSLKLDDIKTEFFSNLFAKKIYENNCSMETLMVAEEKVNYLKSKNVKQGEIKFAGEKIVQNMLEISGALPRPVAFCGGAGGGSTVIALQNYRTL